MPAAETLAQRIDALSAHFTIVRPDGPGPFATVVLLHGCGGRKPLMDRWADVVKQSGCAAIIVDSYAHRRISRVEAYATVCMGLRLWGRERAGDLYATLAYARAQDWCDANRIVAAGWSHGAWTIMDALTLTSGGEMARATGLADLPAEPLDGVVATFLAYPYAGRASLAGRRAWRMHPNTCAIACGRDDIVGRQEPRRMLNGLKAKGESIDVHWFETATHAFDEAEAHDGRVRYDAALTARAHELMRDLLKTV